MVPCAHTAWAENEGSTEINVSRLRYNFHLGGNRRAR